MRINYKAVRQLYKDIYPYFIEGQPDTTVVQSFLHSVISLIHIIAENARDHDLIKVFYIDAIRTRNSNLILRISELIYSLIQHELLTPTNLNKEEIERDKKLSAKNHTDLSEVIRLEDTQLLIAIEKELLETDIYYPALINLRYYTSTIMDDFIEFQITGYSDFSGLDVIISAIAKYGGIKEPVDFIRKIKFDADASLSGEEAEEFNRKMDRIIDDIEKIAKTEYESRTLVTIDKVFEAIQSLIFEGLINSSVTDFVSAFSDKEGRTTITFGNISNLGEAGCIISLFNQCHFCLPSKILNGVKLNCKGEPKEYRKTKPSIYKYVSQDDAYDEYHFDKIFIAILIKIYSILEVDPVDTAKNIYLPELTYLIERVRNIN